MIPTPRSPQDSRSAPVASLAAPLALAAVALACALLPSRAGADWLVLHDGSRVETRGAWEVKGRQVVFRLTDGTLSSLKSDQVDLEASREATRAAEEAASRPAAPPAPREPAAAETPRRKWTNADIPRGTPPPPPGEEPAGDGAEAATESAAGEEAADGETGDVTISAWDRRERPAGDGLEIYGTVRNERAGTVASGVRVKVVLFDRSGGQVAETTAQVTPSTIPDGGRGEFVASFPSVFDFGAVRFQATSVPIDVAQGEQAESPPPPPGEQANTGEQPNT